MYKKELLHCIAVICLSLISSSLLAEHYHFDYRLSGSQKILPLQVFDDGNYTYFHFPDNVEIPAVFSVDAQGMSLLHLLHKNRFWMTSCCYGRFTLVLGTETAVVTSSRIWPEKAMLYKPFVVQQDKKSSLSMPIQHHDVFRMVKSDSDTPVSVNWLVRRSDRTLHQLMLSWANRAHYQLLWRIKGDFSVVADAQFHGDFLSVMHQLLTTLIRQGVLLRFRVYEKNHVLIVEPYPNDATASSGD